MQLSKEIKAQAERYEKTGAFHLSHPQKVELSNIHKELFGGGVNTSCSTCVATALSLVYNNLKVKEESFEVQLPENVGMFMADEQGEFQEVKTGDRINLKTEFKGVKEYTLKELKPLKIAELKKIAEGLGIEVIGKQTKAEIIKSIINK